MFRLTYPPTSTPSPLGVPVVPSCSRTPVSSLSDYSEWERGPPEYTLVGVVRRGGYLAGVRGCIYRYGISVSSVGTLQALYPPVRPLPVAPGIPSLGLPPSVRVSVTTTVREYPRSGPGPTGTGERRGGGGGGADPGIPEYYQSSAVWVCTGVPTPTAPPPGGTYGGPSPQ